MFGLAIECLFGEPRCWHLLLGFGRLANAMECCLNKGRMGIAIGAISVMALVAIPIFAFMVLRTHAQSWAWVFDGLALWFALGAKSLFTHVRAIAQPLMLGDLPAARIALSMIVSRDCAQLTETEVAKGAIESNLENGADAIFATLFWFALLGGAGALLHRLSNTLDAMWGYRTPRFNEFGRFAARLDDVLNYLPARLVALSYALLGNTRLALTAWRTQAPLWDSPNAGPVMAAGAGALNLTLGGNAIYHGQVEMRTPLGFGPAPQAPDIERSLRLVQKTLALWLLSCVALPGLMLLFQGWL
ncbi:cobalamin biosynthesis protein [Deefgea chitinilytica]|uniref:Cobalamin biosynthesis protein CobD n=2 Tax=Chitinibacteraceae TaxID=2897177 RepID=A0ABS2CAI3_9NEIS|nr:cobalamin biosynthesis protein [Deefgea chitinilytica]MBM9888377.1 cobalamin biosynthesis protein [Deefgea sp. CFH1-16]